MQEDAVSPTDQTNCLEYLNLSTQSHINIQESFSYKTSRSLMEKCESFPTIIPRSPIKIYESFPKKSKKDNIIKDIEETSEHFSIFVYNV